MSESTNTEKKFNSIEEIVKFFGIEESSISEIRKALRSLMKEVHPDPSGGENFSSEKKEREYYEIKNAIEFIDSLNGHHEMELVSSDTIRALVKSAVNEIIALRGVNTEEVLTRKQETLSDRQIHYTRSYRVKHRGIKITSSVFATIITALWLFPETVQNHMMLRHFIPHPYTFSMVWLFAIVVTGILWFNLLRRERRMESMVKSYSLESVQNNVFSSFVDWCYPQHNFFTQTSDYRDLEFSKDDLINFLMNEYHEYKFFMAQKDQDFLEKNSRTQGFLNRQKNSNHSKDEIFWRMLEICSLGTIYRIREIDLEIAISLADVIMQRLITRGVVMPSDQKGLSDLYLYKKEH